MREAAVDRQLAAARRRIGRRVQAPDLVGEIESESLVVDIRPEGQRRQDGVLPGALVIDRNVLEWRLDPTCAHRLPGFDRTDRRVVVVCNEGYASSLAAASLRDLGLLDVTDLDGGFQAWLAFVASPSVQPDTPGGGERA